MKRRKIKRLKIIRGKMIRTLLPITVALAVALIASMPVTAEEPDLVILHTNDMHARIESSDGLLGMPMIGSLIEYHRDRYPHVLVLDAGDALHGLPIANQLQGRSVVESMNAAGYDAMAPGNHDFNYGYQRLLELETMMEFDLLAANVYHDGEALFRPYTVRELGEYRIGLFGLATPDTYQTTHPRNIQGIEFADMVEEARRSVQALREEGVDLVIAIGHVGFGRNYPSTDVSAAVDGIDLFVDGHSHDLLMEGEIHDGTLFVQANDYTKYLGKVEVRFTDSGPEMTASMITPADARESGLTPDESIEEMLLAFRDEIRQRMLGTWED